MELLLQERVLFEHDFLGTALSRLPEDYEGPCVVELEGRTKSVIAFHDVSNAEAAARFAVGELGGYSLATVDQTPEVPDNVYACWSDWAFG